MKPLSPLLLALTFSASSAYAEFTLDKRYIDKDNDLIADIPTDKSKLIAPSILISSSQAKMG